MGYWPWTGWISPQREALRRLRHIADQNDRIIALLTTLDDQEAIMAADLSALTNAVEAEQGVIDGVVVLLNQLAADLAAAANDPATVQALADQITANTATLAAAVAANTPAAPDAEPAPVDEPPADAPPVDAPVDVPADAPVE